MQHLLSPLQRTRGLPDELQAPADSSDRLQTVYFHCSDVKSHSFVRAAFGPFFADLRSANPPPDVLDSASSALERVDAFLTENSQRTVLDVPLHLHAHWHEVLHVRDCCLSIADALPESSLQALSIDALKDSLDKRIFSLQQQVQDIYEWFLYLVFLDVKGDAVLIEQTLTRLGASLHCEMLELIVSWSSCRLHFDAALQTVIDGYPTEGGSSPTLQILEARHKSSLYYWLNNWSEGVASVWGPEKLSEDDEGRVLWETFFQHYFKVMWHDFLEAFEHVYLVERLPVDIVTAFQRRMDPKGCQHITKVVWSKLICQAKRCAVILQSLVTEVVSNLPGYIYRAKPLAPLPQPPVTDRCWQPDGEGLSLPAILRTLGCKSELNDDWVERVLEDRKKGVALKELHHRSSLLIWWLDAPGEPPRVTATRLVQSEIALTTKLAILRVSSGELGNHASAMENYGDGAQREALPGLLISPHTSKWCNVTRFGRNSSRQTLLPDWPMSEPIASRSHFNILYKPEEEKFYLMDASSKWGTFVKLTSAVPLCCGNWIRVGGVEFVVRYCGGGCKKAKSHHQHYHLHSLRLASMHIKRSASCWDSLKDTGDKDFRQEVLTSLLESRRRAIPHIPPSVWMWNDQANLQPDLPVSWGPGEDLEPRREDSDDEREPSAISRVTAPIAPLELEFISGPRMGERITVTSPVCTLGRADGNGVQVNDSQLASVSRVHCTFQFSGDRWYLHDNKSTNGTWRRLSCVLEPSVPVPLDHGVAIQAGTHQFEVEVFSTPFAILPSVLQEVMLKLFGTGGQRLNTSAGRGPLLGPPGREKNGDGEGSDGDHAASARSAPPGSVDVSVNATVGSHEAA